MSHIYEQDNLNFPSVTTVLQILGSKKLLKWANYQGFKHIDIDRVLEQTSEFGTIAHSVVQGIVDKDNAEVLQPKDALMALDLDNLAKKFSKLLSNHEWKTIYTEHTLISRDLGYAGTLDWLCELDGKKTLIDFKTSKMVKTNHILQLGGYDNLLKNVENIDVEQHGIILISADKCKLHIIDEEEIKTAKEAFNILYEFYKLWGEKIK